MAAGGRAEVNRRVASRLAWGTLVASIACYVAAAGLALTRHDLPVGDLIGATGSMIFSVVGAIVAARVPGNPVGWILCAFGFLGVASVTATEYAHYSLVTRSGSLPGGEIAAWFYGSVGISVPPALFAFAFLLFPSGRLPSRRWTVVGWTMLAFFTLYTVGLAFAPGPMDLTRVDNPFAIHPAAGLLRALAGLGDGPLIGIALLLPAISLIARYRSAGAVERQQLKWFMYAAALLGIEIILFGIVETTMGRTDIGDVVGFSMFIVTLLAIAAAIGIAILKYRLYDIDRIINRTLVYGALSAVLAGVYALCVVVLPAVVGVGRGSEVVVAASTLLVAALFTPVRRRIQGFIDRRFYRSRYDAQRTVEAFGQRLRNEVQLDEVTSDLLTVVGSTLKPARASLWLRAGGRG